MYISWAPQGALVVKRLPASAGCTRDTGLISGARRSPGKGTGVCAILNRETGAIKGRKTAMKNLGFNNQFQKAGGKKDSGNGKAHTKKTKDPNVGTGYITYA